MPTINPRDWIVWEDHAQVHAGPAKVNNPGRLTGTNGKVCECPEDEFGEDDEEGKRIAMAHAVFIAAMPDVFWALSDLVAERPMCYGQEPGDPRCGTCGWCEAEAALVKTGIELSDEDE